MKSTVVAASRFLLLLLLAFAEGARAFAPAVGSPHASSSLSLHPDQAQELADCAQDLMKRALEESKLEAIDMLKPDIYLKLKTEAANVDEECLILDDDDENQVCGPIGWARKRLWPFKGQDAEQGRLDGGLAAKMP